MSAEAQEILVQIQAGKWGWMKVMRFDPNAYSDLKQRNDAIEKHHVAETEVLVSIAERLCRAIVEKQ